MATRHRKIYLSNSSKIIRTGEIDPISRGPFQPGEVVVLCEKNSSAIKLSSWDPINFDRCPFCGDPIRTIQLEQTEYDSILIDEHPPYANLLIIKGPGRGRRIAIRKQDFRIGRRATNDFRVRDKQVSRHHARIVHAAGNWYLQDLRSTNGTLHNNIPTSATRLYSGDTLTIGNSVLVFESGK